MFPLELVTMLGSAVFSGVMTLWTMKLKADAQRTQSMIDGLAAQTKGYVAAREYGHKNPKFEFTRRIIALATIFSVIVLPKVAAVFFPTVPVLVGYTEFHPGFWFFTDGAEVIQWRQAAGFVITPLDTHLVSAIAGLYFGASVVKNA